MTYQRNQEMRGLWAQGLPPVLSWAARMSTLSSRRRGGPQQLQGQPLAELWHSKLMAWDPSCLGRSWVLTCRVGGAVPCPYTVTIHLHLKQVGTTKAWLQPRGEASSIREKPFWGWGSLTYQPSGGPPQCPLESLTDSSSQPWTLHPEAVDAAWHHLVAISRTAPSGSLCLGLSELNPHPALSPLAQPIPVVTVATKNTSLVQKHFLHEITIYFTK